MFDYRWNDAKFNSDDQPCQTLIDGTRVRGAAYIRFSNEDITDDIEDAE